MIPIKCPSCGAKYRLEDEMAGKKVKCRCGVKMLIPSENAMRLQHLENELNSKDGGDDIKPAPLNSNVTINVKLDDVAAKSHNLPLNTCAVLTISRKFRVWFIVLGVITLLTAILVLVCKFFFPGFLF